MSTQQFLSAEPVVELAKSFTTPFKNALATARTCYSPKGIIDDDDVDLEKFTPLARSMYEAGHHTTFQHAQFQFKLSNVSRHFIWSFLHSHPFYNSEQVSQRYVAVEPDSYAIPPLPAEATSVYIHAVNALFLSYQQLTEALTEPSAHAFYRIFPARAKQPEKYKRTIRKKAMESARYVLPVSMFAYLYHTVSGITLLRYYRYCRQYDVPLEQRLVVQNMVNHLLAYDPCYKAILEEPLALEETPEFALLQEMNRSGTSQPSAFLQQFDASLGGKTSVLVDYKINAEHVLAESVREVLGLLPSKLNDAEAIDWVLNPARNTTLGEALVGTTHSKLSRALYHVHYTFRKKLSHTADSQDQRHRMTPASRPILSTHLTNEPDFITPKIIAQHPKIMAAYKESMNRAWEAYGKLRSLGASTEFAQYILPNALAVRFTESADLLNLHHKHIMRLCYNAQEEIWNASVNEAAQVRDVHPQIGKYLLPPCTIRDMACMRPVCPEGSRYCGVKVWKLSLDEYDRIL